MASQTDTAGSNAAPGEKGASFKDVQSTWLEWWRESVVGTVDQAAVIEKRRSECNMTARYILMLAMSAGIAVLGLLLSSPAVVIGAMLLSPLMDPIIGLGFALAIGDVPWLKQAGKSLAIGTVLAIVLCALIVFLSPLAEITPEIASRTKPNLLDLLVALFSAIAGAYAMIRGREGTVVGVAIATALMPPLAVVGFGLATTNGTVFWGALLLYVTNLMTIALTAAIMARLYGFRTTLSERNTRLQMIAIIVSFVALAIPLGLSLNQIVEEARATRVIRGAVLDAFDNNARLSQIDFNWDAEPIQVNATVLTPRIEDDAQRDAARAIARQIDRPVNLEITQYRVGTAAQAAEQAQLAKVRATEEASQRRADQLAARLALIAGVSEQEVMVDRERRRALVTALPLDGATLTAYRELEQRIGATEPDWDVQLRPPARALPSVTLSEGEPDENGAVALGLIEWAGKRVGAPIVLTGTAAETEALAKLLSERGVTVRTENGGRAGVVNARWGAPE